MNVIMVCESATVSGGAEKVAIQEAIELARREIRVGFIAAGTEADQGLFDAGVEVKLLDTASFFEEKDRGAKIQKLFWNSTIEPEVLRFLVGFDPQDTVVHLHTFRLRISGVVAHLAQKLGFPTLVHCHDYSPVCPTSLLYDHRMGGNCDRRPMSFSCLSCECQNQPWKYKLPKLTSHWWNQSIWKINRRSKGFIHISELEKSTMSSRMSTPAAAFHLPPIAEGWNGPRVEAERNKPFVFIGRITREKGVDEFLRSALEAGVPSVVVGQGPLSDTLQAEYPTARFTGWLDQDGISKELEQARALVVPSVWRETLCLSVIDAMQMGVPCIVSEHVGAKEFIENDVSGVIFSPGDLAGAIRSFADDTFVQNLSQGAFAVFADNPPTIERHVDELVKIYEGCLRP